jgi:polyhydroxyalkanoate synthesis regulator phasin
MTTEEMERAIEFLLDHHAKVSADIERHSEQIGKLTETVSTLVVEAETDRRETREVLNSMISEIQEGFNKLILSNEVTRDLANNVAALEIQTSQRVTNVERRVTDLESK